MDPKHLYIDERLKNTCAYCAGQPNTKDHVPPKIFLDDPLPVGGFTVEACKECNQATSIDEEYLASFIECVVSGSTDIKQIGRSKIRASLEHSSALREAIRGSFKNSLWYPEIDRVNNVVTKLAQGHIAFEYSECGLGPPVSIETVPIELLADYDRQEFERAGIGNQTLWPEIGSRGFLRAAGAKPFDKDRGPWIVVQEGRYRYSVGLEPHIIVRIVISEYLACLVQW
jgi:hypothetical protein